MPAPPVPACFNAWTRVVPVLRSETARRLIDEGLQQGRIAEHLGVSVRTVESDWTHARAWLKRELSAMGDM